MTAAVILDIRNKITSEQWERLNEVANEAIKCGYFTEDGKSKTETETERALIEDTAVERFVQFLEMYYVTEDDRDELIQREREQEQQKEKTSE